MNKNTRKILIIVGIILGIIIVGFAAYKFLSERNKLVYKEFNAGFGTASDNYEVTIWDSGKVKITRHPNNIFNEEIYFVDKKEIDELKKIIDENLDKVQFSYNEKLDGRSVEIIIYKDGKEHVLDCSWDRDCNENFYNINNKIGEITKNK